ncbi:MAG TPA: DUF4912 domain-containing protein [Fibrobacteraceae bacterium]|nr:DUF4912 domain-containing protein [Fibrobacteraceae bacterium]
MADSKKKSSKSASTKKTASKSAAPKNVIAKASAPIQKVADKVKKTVSVAASKLAHKTAVSDIKKPKPSTLAKPSVQKSGLQPISKVLPKEPVATSKKPTEATSKKPIEHSFSPEYLVLMQKDPNWMQAFWDVNDQRVKTATKGGKKLVLRLYDVSKDLTVRSHRNRTFRDFEVPADARSWYIQNGTHSGSYSISLGTLSGAGQFSPLVDSSKVMAFGSDGQFLGNEDDRFLRASLGGLLPGGFGSSQLGLSSQQSFPWTSSFVGSSENSSWGFSSSGTWNAESAQNLGKDFFLWVKTRLIVYGGTRPDAHLQVRGEPFPLNPDGTFSFEQDLPDSTQIIPVFATDKDGDFPTTIVPVVVKRTE